MSEPARTATIELCKESFKFSAGHFTIFSATSRERLHGHNFAVSCALTGEVQPDGLIADYRRYKRRLKELCDAWDEVLLLPAASPYLTVEPGESEVTIRFAGKRMILPREDVLLLPIRNITLEELSWLLLQALVADEAAALRDRLVEVVMRVSSGPGQWAASRWTRPAPTWSQPPRPLPSPQAVSS
ncbi:MAG: 6-carboxytetrahydropterin synthase [bacterium]|nr:6-carboxytetrahydropterin synthase [Myxococcales bacterium]